MNSKAKGNAGERLICKILTKWLTGNEKPYALYRCPNSGGLATILEMHENFSGDIIGITEDGKKITDIYSLEIKTGYKDTCIDLCLKGNKNENLRDFWIQCNKDSNKANKLPMLIFNKKGTVTKNMWIGLCDKSLKKIKKLKKLSKITITFDDKYNLQDMHLFNFGDFLEKISIEDL